MKKHTATKAGGFKPPATAKKAESKPARPMKGKAAGNYVSKKLGGNFAKDR